MPQNIFNARFKSVEMEHKHITLVNEEINEENEETIDDSIQRKNSTNFSTQRFQS